MTDIYFDTVRMIAVWDDTDWQKNGPRKLPESLSKFMRTASQPVSAA